MKYKVIATDFDGTLLDDNKKVSDYNKKILLKKKEEGKLIIGVTARNLSSIKNVLDINLFNYLIINNGSYVYDCKTKDGYYENFIPDEICLKLVDDINDNDGIDFCTKDIYYKFNNKDAFENDFIKCIDDFKEVCDKVLKINIYVKEQSKIDEILNKINNNYDVDAIFMQDSNNDYKWISLTPKGINKKTSLKGILKKNDISLNDVIFFGDSNNDKELISSLKMGIAMKNAIPSLKKIAYDVTCYDNNDSGVGRYLEKLD